MGYNTERTIIWRNWKATDEFNQFNKDKFVTNWLEAKRNNISGTKNFL